MPSDRIADERNRRLARELAPSAERQAGLRTEAGRAMVAGYKERPPVGVNVQVFAAAIARIEAEAAALAVAQVPARTTVVCPSCGWVGHSATPSAQDEPDRIADQGIGMAFPGEIDDD